MAAKETIRLINGIAIVGIRTFVRCHVSGGRAFKPIMVYNFTVATLHTYTIGHAGILVHNTGCDILKSVDHLATFPPDHEFTLWRAVEEPEFIGLQKDLRFKDKQIIHTTDPMGNPTTFYNPGVKYFSQTREGAIAYAKLALNMSDGGNKVYILIQTSIKRRYLRLDNFEKVDQIVINGISEQIPAFGLQSDQYEHLADAILYKDDRFHR